MKIKIVYPPSPKAGYHVQVRHQDGCYKLADIPDVKQFGREALANIQELARQHTPQGFRVLMRVGESGCQAAGEPISFEILGGEVLRPEIKILFDPNKEPTPSQVDRQPDEYCGFDNIVKGRPFSGKDDDPATPLIFQDDQVTVFRPNRMLAREHLLFVPTRHYRDISRVTDPDFFGSVFARIAEFSQKTEFNEGFMLVSNNGPWGGQAVQHLHFHMRGGEKLDSPFWQDWSGR
jgi:histidine triad (HIT) family protein